MAAHATAQFRTSGAETGTSRATGCALRPADRDAQNSVPLGSIPRA